MAALLTSTSRPPARPPPSPASPPASRAASWRATSRPMPRLAPVTTTVSGFTATHPQPVSGASAAHEVGDEAGELDRLVALDAVSGALHVFDPGTGATAQQLGLVGVVDHRLRQHAPHQHQRNPEAGQRIPQRPEV